MVLINGHLAGLVEFANLPSDAVERVEVLPETVALQYGFSENQLVLNVVLRARDRAVPIWVSESGATEGRDLTTQVDASFVNLSDEARVTMLGTFFESRRSRSTTANLQFTLAKTFLSMAKPIAEGPHEFGNLRDYPMQTS